MSRNRMLVVLPILFAIGLFTVVSCGGCGLLSDGDRELMQSMDNRIAGLTSQLAVLNQKEDFTSLNSKLEQLNETLLLLHEALPTNADQQIEVLDYRFNQLNNTLSELNVTIQQSPLNDSDAIAQLLTSIEQAFVEIQSVREDLDSLASSGESFDNFLEEHEDTFELMHRVFADFEELMAEIGSGDRGLEESQGFGDD